MPEQQPTLTFKDWDPSWGIWGVVDPMDLDNGWYGPNNRQPLDDELLDKLAWMVEQGAPPNWRFFAPHNTDTGGSGYATTLVIFGVVDKDQSERYVGIDVVTIGRNPASALHGVAFNLHLTLPPSNNRTYPGYAVRQAGKVSSPIGEPILPQSANPPTEFAFVTGHDPAKYEFGYVYKRVGTDGVVERFMRINRVGTSSFFGSTIVPGWTKRIDPMFAKDLT
jgi:hypothetical protein